LGGIPVLSTLGYYADAERSKGAYVAFYADGDMYFINATYNQQEDRVKSVDDIIRYFTSHGSGESGIRVVIEGKVFAFDVHPQIVNGRILVPLRAIFEEMGAAVEWDDMTRTVYAQKDETTVALTIGDPVPIVNGYGISLDQPGIIVDGRTLAPLRFVVEVFGGTALWDGATQTAYVSK
jgi:hypothetical protein